MIYFYPLEAVLTLYDNIVRHIHQRCPTALQDMAAIQLNLSENSDSCIVSFFQY